MWKVSWIEREKNPTPGSYTNNDNKKENGCDPSSVSRGHDRSNSSEYGSVKKKNMIKINGHDNLIKTKKLKLHECGVIDLLTCTVGNEQMLVSCGEDHTIKVTRLRDKREVTTFRGHGGEVRSLAFMYLDGKPTLISGSNDSTVRLWSLGIHQYCLVAIVECPNRVWSVTSVDGKTCKIAIGLDCGSIGIWNVNDGNDVHTLEGEGHVDAVYALEFFYYVNSLYLCSGSADKSCKVWWMDENQKLLVTFSDYTNPISSLCIFDYWEDKIIVCGEGGWMPRKPTISLWKMSDFKRLHIFPTFGRNTYVNVFISNNKVILVACGDKAIQFWNVQKRMLTKILNLKKNIISLALYEDIDCGAGIYAGDIYGNIYCWQNRVESNRIVDLVKCKPWSSMTKKRS